MLRKTIILALIKEGSEWLFKRIKVTLKLKINNYSKINYLTTIVIRIIYKIITKEWIIEYKRFKRVTKSLKRHIN